MYGENMEVYREETILQTSGQPLLLLQNNTAVPRVMVQPHWHPVCEVLYIRRGHGTQQLNNTIGKLRTGDLVFIRPGDIHATEALAPEGMDVDVLQMTDTLLSGTEKSWRDVPSCILSPTDSSFSQLFDAFAHLPPPGTNGREYHLSGLALLLLSLLLRRSDPSEEPGLSPAIQAVCSHLHSSSDLRLQTVAHHFGYSPEHLSRRFHSETGITYRAYCDQLRMRQATILLHRPGENVSSVAEALGYSDASSFIRAFRNIYGITPSTYRKLCRPWEQPNS